MRLLFGLESLSIGWPEISDLILQSSTILFLESILTDLTFKGRHLFFFDKFDFFCSFLVYDFFYQTPTPTQHSAGIKNKEFMKASSKVQLHHLDNLIQNRNWGIKQSFIACIDNENPIFNFPWNKHILFDHLHEYCHSYQLICSKFL